MWLVLVEFLRLVHDGSAEAKAIWHSLVAAAPIYLAMQFAGCDKTILDEVTMYSFFVAYVAHDQVGHLINEIFYPPDGPVAEARRDAELAWFVPGPMRGDAWL